MKETDLLHRHKISKEEPIANYKAVHLLFLSITLLGVLSLLLNIAHNLKNSLFTLSGTIPEILFTLLGLLLFTKFKPWEKVFCYFYDDKFTISHGLLNHSEDELFFEHIRYIEYKRSLINTHEGEKSFDTICFHYEEEEVHLNPTGWPDDFHRLLHYYAAKNNIPLTIEEELEKIYKINA